MDLSFEIKNAKGDHIMVALSYYDANAVMAITHDPIALTLMFYDVTLRRESGESYVGYKMLSTISDTLARFMKDNKDMVLCFYCDATLDVRRHHNNMLPQEYRSRLFSKMFDIYVQSHHLTDLVNLCIKTEDPTNPTNTQFAHFICREQHEQVVAKLGQMLTEK